MFRFGGSGRSLDHEDDVVVYLEEPSHSGNASTGESSYRNSSAVISRDNRMGFDEPRSGPAKRVFGYSKMTVVDPLQRQPISSFDDSVFDFEEISSQGAISETLLPKAFEFNGIQRPIERLVPVSAASTMPNSKQQPNTPQFPNADDSKQFYSESRVAKNSMKTPLSGSHPTNTRSMDRPAHWGLMTTTHKLSSSHKRPMSSVKNDAPVHLHHQQHLSTYTSFKKKKSSISAIETPNSLERLSFQPSWLKSKPVAPTSTPAVAMRPVVGDDIDDDWVENPTNSRLGWDRNGLTYDRIEDISNSACPPFFIETHNFAGNGRANSSESGSMATGLPSSFPVSPYYNSAATKYSDTVVESPVKSTRNRKLKHFGTLLKRVCRAAEGTEARWSLLLNLGQLHRGIGRPLRYDLGDPRCTAKTCIEIRILNEIPNDLLKIRDGLELYLVRIEGLMERQPSSADYTPLQTIEVLSIDSVNPRLATCAADQPDVPASAPKVITISEGSEAVAYFRSSTMQMLHGANNNMPLANKKIRIYDYCFLPPERIRLEAYSIERTANSEYCRLILTNVSELHPDN